MKLKIDTIGMSIIPESPQDEIYLESMFSLKHDGDKIIGMRHNAHNLSCWNCIKFKIQNSNVNTSDTTCMPCECTTETI